MKNQLLGADELTAVRWYVLSVPQFSAGLHARLGLLMDIRRMYGDERRPAMEYFVPMLVRKVFTDGGLADVSRPFCSYVFIKGSCAQLRDFHAENPTYNLIPDAGRGAGYIFVGDGEMETFRYALRAYNGCAPFVADCPQLLEKGDRVRIVLDGPFYGMEGTLVSRKGKDGGRVLIRICDNIAIPTFEIESRYLQPLSYSDGNKHLYRRLDIYHPQAMAAMRSYMRDGELRDEAERSRVNDFAARFSRLTVDSGKMRGRFLTYMLMSVTALNADKTDIRSDAVAYYTHELSANIRHITNATTLALARCALYTATGARKHLEKARELRGGWDDGKLTDKQRDVACYIKWCDGDFS